MSLQHVLTLLEQDAAFRRLLGHVEEASAGCLSDIPGPARAPVVAALAHRFPAVLVIVPRADQVAEMVDAVRAMADVPADAWPTSDAIPYERLARDRVTTAERLGVMARLLDHDQPVGVLVAPARGLMQLLPQPAELARATQMLRSNDDINLAALLKTLVAQGYESVSVVESPGTFARRGGIIDIWPPTSDRPVRVELWGETVDSLRTFDPGSQRSEQRIDRLVVPPPIDLPLWQTADAVADVHADADLRQMRVEAREEWQQSMERLRAGTETAELELLAPYLLPRPASILDYLPAGALVVADTVEAVHLAGAQLEAQAEELRERFELDGELPHGLRRPYHTWAETWAGVERRQRLYLGAGADGSSTDVPPDLGFRPAPVLGGRLDRLTELVRSRIAGHARTVLATSQSQRVSELLAEHEIFATVRKARPKVAGAEDGNNRAVPRPGSVEVVHLELDGGWEHVPSQTLVLSDREIFGWTATRRTPRRRSAAAARALLQRLRPGDYVVHIEHGVALYQGLVKREAAGVEREFMLLQYSGADRLYVPVDQSDRVLPYAGPSDAQPTLNRLGSPDWERTKRRVRRAVADLAHELLQVYAAREMVPGHAFAPDGLWQGEMEEAFPYEETPDQHQAIVDVKEDMERPQPMDRLICGDVGYGKTEVALRAAFKAVSDGRQVAVLVPTTVLALQHFETFKRRLEVFPVRVEMLSRLRTKREQADVVAGLASGAVDIVIGTHRLLQRDVRFRSLGLVIVDEEQRFGVRHKERLKQLRVEVDVLTLSATPIPRTLHMSLVGVRDMSIIETPPGDRLPIRTFVRPASDDLMREVILRELSRGGQVYFVHNRVQSIYHVADRLRELVPEARFLLGHGQMDADALEDVMLDFVAHEADVLVCTTIIESGLDIANVNTLIVDDAVNFGLAQLYQLRGRVGRSSNRAYAYLLYNATRPLSYDAQERLSIIQEASELGAGFRIALRDLELRGAGNLLGAAQHGHMEAVGFELYTRLLAQAVEVARGNPPPRELPPIKLDLPLDAHLPANYVPDADLRLALYQRLAQPSAPHAIVDLERELVDRFGPLPEPARNLLEVLRIKSRALDLGVDSIGVIEGELVVRPVATARLDERHLTRALKGVVRTTPSTVRLKLSELGDGWLAALHTVLDAAEHARERALATVG